MDYLFPRNIIILLCEYLGYIWFAVLQVKEKPVSLFYSVNIQQDKTNVHHFDTCSRVLCLASITPPAPGGSMDRNTEILDLCMT